MEAGGLEVGGELAGVGGVKGVDGFQFDDDAVLNEQIEAPVADGLVAIAE